MIFYLVGNQIIIIWACGARYSCNNQHTQNHTITFYKGVWVYCIFPFLYSKNWRRYVHCKFGVFSSFWGYLLVIMLFFNSPFSTFRLEHHGVRIRAPPFLQMAKEMLLPNHFQKLYIHLCVTLPLVPCPVPTTSWID